MSGIAADRDLLGVVAAEQVHLRRVEEHGRQTPFLPI
jgi:hypothetical protein